MNRQTSLRMTEMMRALAPFARMADEYDNVKEDSTPVLAAGRTDDPIRITVADLRAARDALID